jgi:cytochrome b561
MIRNDATNWGWPAKALHWIAAAAILLLLVHGWWMTHLAPRPERLANYAWHAALGYDLLALLLVRLVWRWANEVPALPATSRWERLAAHVSHTGLYVLMFAASVTGWALAGTFRSPLAKDLIGLPVPALVQTQDRSVHALLEESHTWLSYGLALIVVIHLLAALRHHFVKRNDVFRRMVR